MRIFNFGSLNLDYVYRVNTFLRKGETKATESMTIDCGGKGLNQSVACAKAGLEVYHVGIIGNQGEMLKEKLEDNDVYTQFIKQENSANGHAIIQVDDSGDNCILLYAGTNHMLTEEYIDEVLMHCKADDIVLIQNETNLVDVIIEKASQKKIPIAFNAAPMTDKVLDYPLECIDWLFVNEVEGEALSGEKEENLMLDQLSHKYPKMHIILTLGEKGSMYKGPEGICSCNSVKANVVNTTAAGDTFTGYYLSAILEGRKPIEALNYASKASAITVSREGAADSIPIKEEVI